MAVIPCHMAYALICIVSFLAGILSPALNLPETKKLPSAY
jgi:hypothetical protein